MSVSSVDTGATLSCNRDLDVVVVRLGDLDAATAAPYTTVMQANARVDLANLTLPSSSPLPFRRSSVHSGYVTLRFVSNTSSRRSTAWDELYLSRRVFGVIGLIHCPSCPELSEPYEEFLRARKLYPNALRSRCFAFDPLDSQADLVEREDLIMFPNSDPKHLQFYMNTILTDFASFIVEDIAAKARDAKALPFPRSPLDPPQEDLDASRLRRLLPGRQQKQVADMALLCGCVLDAQDGYNASKEACKSSGDTVWYAASHEGLASCEFALSEDDPAAVPSALRQEVVDRLEKAFKALSKRPRTSVLQVEMMLKLARYYSACNQAVAATSALMRAYEVAESLGAREQIAIAMEAAIMCQRFGFHRKFGLFVREAALLFSEMFQWRNCHHLSLLTAPIYGLGTLRGQAAPFPTRLWPTLQRAVLEELTVSAQGINDHRRVAVYIALLLRSQATSMSPSHQEVLISELANATSRLPLKTALDMTGLPKILAASVVEPDKHLRPCRRKPRVTRQNSDDVFLFRPAASKSTSDVLSHVVSCSELIQVDIHLANPLDVPLYLDSLSLVGSGMSYECFPRSLRLAPKSASPTVVRLSVRPNDVGLFSLIGVCIRVFNIEWTHKLTDQRPIEVVTQLPKVSVGLDALTRELLFGEQRTLKLRVHNVGHVDVVELSFDVLQRGADNVPPSVTCDADELDDLLPLRPGQVVFLSLHLTAQQQCHGAEVRLTYAEVPSALWYRQASVNLAMTPLRGVQCRSVDIYPFGYGLALPTSTQTQTQTPSAMPSLGLLDFADDDCMLVLEVSNTSSEIIRLVFHSETDARHRNSTVMVEESRESQRVFFPMRRTSFGARDDDVLCVLGVDPLRMHDCNCSDVAFVRCRNALVDRLRLLWFASEDIHGAVDLCSLRQLLTPAMMRHVVPDPFVVQFQLKGCTAPARGAQHHPRRTSSLTGTAFSSDAHSKRWSSCCDAQNDSNVAGGDGSFNFRLRHCSGGVESDFAATLRRLAHSEPHNTEKALRIVVPPVSNPLSPIHQEASETRSHSHRFYPVGQFRKVSVLLTNRSVSQLSFEVEVRPRQETAQGEFSYELRRQLLWTGSLAFVVPLVDAGCSHCLHLNLCFLVVGRFHFEFVIRYRREAEATSAHLPYISTVPLLLEAFDAEGLASGYDPGV